MGGGVTAYIVGATAGNPRALVMQSTFASLKETAANGFPMTRWVIEAVYGVDFDSQRNLAGYPNCYFQYHGDDDDTVPLEDGEKLYNSVSATSNPACTELFVQPGLGHDDDMSAAEQAATTTFVNAHARDP